MFTLRAKMLVRDGLTFGENCRAFLFDVLGLPDGQQAQIAERRHMWTISRGVDGVYGEWTGQYHSPEEALASLTI